ncbi:hypothetical protein [Nocardia sp. CDC160]|uniref:hypothetical protein n=1 Tax=Nocardia sp. CDC160 TaxID=3112166 RepID=UPI002DBE52CA|nr:hypothetical protein [Nocardia sp. CDC160]MEC3920339.1 hypothetical protein [Nocardia sp. CDC160]
MSGEVEVDPSILVDVEDKLRDAGAKVAQVLASLEYAVGFESASPGGHDEVCQNIDNGQHGYDGYIAGRDSAYEGLRQLRDGLLGTAEGTHEALDILTASDQASGDRLSRAALGPEDRIGE